MQVVLSNGSKQKRINRRATMARALSDSSAALADDLSYNCDIVAQYGGGTAVGGQRAQNNNNASTAPATARDLQSAQRTFRRSRAGARKNSKRQRIRTVAL